AAGRDLGGALRELGRRLRELSPDGNYGGLRVAMTPAGYRLWLCSFHHAALRQPPLQLGGPPPYDAYLCYRSQDKDVVRKIAGKLKHAGLRYWLDKERVLGGERWQDALERGLRESACAVVCIGAQFWGGWQREELQFALTQAAGRAEYRVIPLLLPG